MQNISWTHLNLRLLLPFIYHMPGGLRTTICRSWRCDNR